MNKLMNIHKLIARIKKYFIEELTFILNKDAVKLAGQHAVIFIFALQRKCMIQSWKIYVDK